MIWSNPYVIVEFDLKYEEKNIEIKKGIEIYFMLESTAKYW